MYQIGNTVVLLVFGHTRQFFFDLFHRHKDKLTYLSTARNSFFCEPSCLFRHPSSICLLDPLQENTMVNDCRQAAVTLRRATPTQPLGPRASPWPQASSPEPAPHPRRLRARPDSLGASAQPLRSVRA